MEEDAKNHLLKLGYDLKKIYYTNAIKCRTPKGHKIKESEVKKCSVHLHEEIKRIKPKYVLLLGSQAVKAALNKKITDIQGSVHEHDGIKYFATYSPKMIYYDVKRAPVIEKDLKLFKRLYQGKKKVNADVQLNIKVIDNMKDLKEAIKWYRKNYTSMSYDIETTGLNRYLDKINAIGFGNNKVQFILPIHAKFGPLERKPIARRKLAEYLIKQIDRFKNKIGANVKFDNLFLEQHYGIKPTPTFDVNLASHLLNENTHNGLKENAVQEFGAANWDIDTNLKKGKIVSHEKYLEFLNYLAHDIYWTHRLYLKRRKQLRKDKSLLNLYKYLYMPVSIVYEDIEREGVYYYKDRFEQLEMELRTKLDKIVADMYATLPKELRNQEINWNSDKQIGKLLYEDLGIKIIETTKAGAPATGESVLKRLSKEHPVVPLILDYRGVAIQISHFIDGWISRTFGGRLHPSFKVDGTVTGRTSCKDPNLQQVPRDKAIRSLIGAPEGWTLIESDYSQLELRVAAEVSGDSTMRRLFQMGEDIHTNTGRAVSGKDELSYEERKRAKAVNFGFVYGMGWRKFKDYARDSYDVHLTDKEAQQYRKKFFAMYHELPEWHDRQKKIVHYLGEVRNPIGRIRRLPDINSKDKGKVAEAERQSINSPVQGFGSDLCLLSLIEAYNYFPREWTRCVGTVHDAQLWLVRNDKVKEFCIKLKQIMESPTVLKTIFKFEPTVPIVTDVEIGNWGKGMELDEWLKENPQYDVAI
jgi:DNA polymerase-1